MIRDSFKKVLRAIFATQGLVIHAATEKKKVARLIERLYPLQTQLDLIRLGPDGDGGYLVPNKLDQIEACFSPGIGEVSGFEKACIKRNMKVFMADKSVEEPKLDEFAGKYTFLKKFIGSTNDNDYITMDNWVESSGVSKDTDLLLQMDIEGDEYHSFLNMSNKVIERFRIMVIEFHYLDYLWMREFFKVAEIVFSKILQNHICVHIHPNNYRGIDSKFGINIPEVAEFTFLRKDCVKNVNFVSSFPHVLDSDNNSSNDSIVLPKDWYKNQ